MQAVVLLLAGVAVNLAAATSVLMPLYIYPTASAWNPLLSAITAYPNLKFTVIINPNSGPSNFDVTYQAAVANLRTFGNVELIGYVRTGYASRSMDEVESDVATYNSWPASYGVDGIFFDEVKDERYTYYSTLYSSVHSKSWPNTQAPSVVLNPGTAISISYFNIAEQIVVFESGYAAYKESIPTISNTKSAIIIHSFEDPSGLDDLVKSLAPTSSMFITDLNIANTDVYAAFGSDFAQFAFDVANLSGAPSSPANSSNVASRSYSLSSITMSSLSKSKAHLPTSSSSHLSSSSKSIHHFRPIKPTKKSKPKRKNKRLGKE